MLDYYNEEIKPLADKLGEWDETAEPWDIHWLTSELNRILERYEHDEGANRDNYRGMCALAGDLTKALCEREGYSEPVYKVYYDKMLDNSKQADMSLEGFRKSLEEEPF